jgi:hypothetical protein
VSADTHWMRTPHSRRIYDYRIRQTICETGDRDLFPELDIPRSTVRSWIHRGVPDVVTGDLVLRDRPDLLVEIQELRHRVALLGAVIGLLTAMLRVSRVRFDFERLPDGEDKRILLRAINRSGKAMPLLAALRITRLSPSRYHSWCRAEVGCDRGVCIAKGDPRALQLLCLSDSLRRSPHSPEKVSLARSVLGAPAAGVGEGSLLELSRFDPPPTPAAGC